MRKNILRISIITISLVFFQGIIYAQKNLDTVYYYIDADIKSSGAVAAGGTYARSQIRTALWQEREILVDKFKIKLKEKFPHQPNINSRVVFRWEAAMPDIKNNYEVKEAKMKKENYTIVQVD